jgi:hypothetical protein
MRRRIVAIALSMFLPFGATAAELLPELGTDAVLERPKGKPRGSIILMPGTDGDLRISGEGEITRLRNNSLIRNRRAFVAGGYATLALSSTGSPARAIEAMRKVANPVIVVGTSRAGTRIHRAVSADAIVIASGMLDHFQSNVGSAEALPPTLVIHHRRDGCRLTLPALVPEFQNWAGARARIVWVDGGRDEGDPCQAGGYHGFNGIDGKLTGAVLAFARGVRPR